MDELADVTITAPDPDWLADFTRRLVADGLVACGNVVPGVRSLYAWDGEVQDDREALVILHTRRALVPAIIERANAEHPYDSPQVLVLPVVDAAPRYRDWLLAWTASPGDTAVT